MNTQVPFEYNTLLTFRDMIATERLSLGLLCKLLFFIIYQFPGAPYIV